MFDASPIDLQRSRGTAEVAVSANGRLDRLYQQGCAKAFLPRCHGPEPEIVFLNTAGGVTGGDRLSYSVAVGAGATATATTQTAERAYRAQAASVPGKISVRATVAAGAALHWLPQETILFDGASLDRRTVIDLADDAALLMCETLVLGRAAMGEEVRQLSLLDHRTVRRAGAPVWIEPLALGAGDLATDSCGAGVDGCLALTTIALVASGAEDLLAPVRRILDAAPDAAATAWDGKLIVRALTADARRARALTIDVLRELRGRALPRVWQL